ncbi:pre-peptidase C-terminal domain-containing protein [Pseudoalteromonas sp. DY56-GL79]|uniref:pre-peptidase C-terminal domain-containing protein n=1 Tax=Pseudoalteromonas sp. DY56-GL79 TaxID=2967131 RepID=UPI00352AC9DD
MRKLIFNSIALFTFSAGAHATATLTSGLTETNSISQGQWQHYQISALQDATRLTVAMTDLSSDVDLYVRVGNQPTLSNYNCRPYKEGSEDEVCDLTANASGQIYISVHGFTTASYKLKVNLGSEDNNLEFPSNGTDWYSIIGSDFHTSNGGYSQMDDTYAIDLNRPENADGDLDVTAIADGTVIARSTSLGFVLVQHDSDLTLGDGTVLNPWFSGYMHMSGTLPLLETNVSTNTVLGTISNVGTTADHLHFAIYSGSETNISGMESIDIGNKLIDFYQGNVPNWHEWCGNTPRATHILSRPWWDSVEEPCPYPAN